MTFKLHYNHIYQMKNCSLVSWLFYRYTGLEFNHVSYHIQYSKKNAFLTTHLTKIIGRRFWNICKPWHNWWNYFRIERGKKRFSCKIPHTYCFWLALQFIHQVQTWYVQLSNDCKIDMYCIAEIVPASGH